MSAIGPGSTLEMNYAVTAVVTFRNDTRDLGVFDTFEGGGATADSTKHRRGAMGEERSYGGPRSVANITISRDYDLARDHSIAHWLLNITGQATMTVNKQPLDEFGLAFGRPLVYTGKLVGATPPNHDSDSSDLGMFELELEPNGSVG